ncbi:LptA/OstA family protein [Rickettsia endosymbiont of Halotydeus destructor]|uniref:LptA/OstA family protein n=1 Tax=Rickettsia endosymbiont of Halotydeus destructor TaxID=2996754 RepID=UPI003BB0063D
MAAKKKKAEALHSNLQLNSKSFRQNELKKEAAQRNILLGSSDRDDAVYIESDSLIIDRIKQKIKYIGNVIVYFEDAILKTKTLEIVFNIEGNEKTVKYIIIPTKLTIKKTKHDELLIADSAKYFLDNKQLILLGNVILQYKDSILKTDKFVYYIDMKSP